MTYNLEMGKIIGMEDGTYTGVRVNVLLGPTEFIRINGQYVSKHELYAGVVSILARHFDVRVYHRRPFFKKCVRIHWDDGIALRCVGWDITFGGEQSYDDYTEVMPVVVNHIKGLCGMR